MCFSCGNLNGSKKDLCILQRLILIVPEEPLERYINLRDAKIKSRDFPILESHEACIAFQRLLWNIKINLSGN